MVSAGHMDGSHLHAAASPFPVRVIAVAVALCSAHQLITTLHGCPCMEVISGGCGCPLLSLPVQTAARTIRPKIHRSLPEFLRDYPATPNPATRWRDVQGLPPPPPCDWDALLREVLTR